MTMNECENNGQKMGKQWLPKAIESAFDGYMFACHLQQRCKQRVESGKKSFFTLIVMLSFITYSHGFSDPVEG